MARTISIGAQDFADLRESGCFIVDKTGFIGEWWRNRDQVTLICRPRRFGKTLNMSMLECFLSNAYAGRGEELFGGTEVWADEEMRALQGTVPVVSLSFAKVKQRDPTGAMSAMKRILRVAVRDHDYLCNSAALADDDRAFLASVGDSMPDDVAADCLGQLCSMLERHWGTRAVVLLDEYDTPMQEAWLGGYWDQMASFVRSLFNATFKTNPALGRAVITGVTRVSRESIFSDLNNLEIVTATSESYATRFGFTEDEVFAAMDEMGLDDREGVKHWYDGFTFGGATDVYNPWSITNYLNTGVFRAYWANSSGNALVSELLRTGGRAVQSDFETLLAGGTVTKTFDEQVVFSELGNKRGALWSLLLASGYLRVVDYSIYGDTTATLKLTNHETRTCFDKMVAGWFDNGSDAYNEFCRSLLADDLESANDWLGDVLTGCISSFDGGAAGGGASAPENFYHGLVLGLLVELRGRYEVTSNRESGYGRYDVMLCPLAPGDLAFAIEFKVLDARREQTLADTCARALAQIRDKDYARQLRERGIEPERIREVAFGFDGKQVLIEGGAAQGR